MICLATTISKTLRLTPEVIELINNFDGDTFTAKFTTMVNLVYTKKEALYTQIKILRAQRDALAADVADLQRVMTASNRLAAQIKDLSWSLSECTRMGREMQSCVARIARQSPLPPPD